MSDTFQQLLITLRLLAEDPGEADLAPIGAVGHVTLEAEQPDGYVIHFLYTRVRSSGASVLLASE